MIPSLLHGNLITVIVEQAKKGQAMSVKIFRGDGTEENSLSILQMQVDQWEETKNRGRKSSNPKAKPIVVTSSTMSHPTPATAILTIFYQ